MHQSRSNEARGVPAGGRFADGQRAASSVWGPERLAVSDPLLTLAFRRDKAGARKLRLFACACCRLIWDLLPERPGRARVVAAEAKADGLPVDKALAAAARAVGEHAASDAAGLYADVASIYCGDGDAFVAALVASSLAERADPARVGRAAQAALLADLFGRPERPLDRRWLTPEVLELARDAYDRPRFRDLPPLAAQPRRAGCPPHNLLDHLRSPTPHTRGCWALDLLARRPEGRMEK